MILVTGANGFLGQYIVQELLNHQLPVRAYVRNPQPFQAKFPSVQIAQGDVLEVGNLQEAMDGVEYVIHAAATVSFWKKRHAEMMRINEIGTANVVNVCLEKKIKRLLHVSSSSAFGRPEGGSDINEQTKWRESPINSQYGKSKYLAEKQVYRGIEEGLSAVFVNPVIILGSGDWQAPSLRIFSTIFSGLKFYPPGMNGYVAATDVAEVIRRLLFDQSIPNGEKFLLCAENWYYKDLFELIAKELNVPPPSIAIRPWMQALAGNLYEFLATFTGKEPLVTRETVRTGSGTYRYDGSKITRTIDFHYRSIPEVIHETCLQFLKEHGNSR
ncbi:MAG: NAD-dependent epimerase/dehydratase family protein [Bacteroidia bacterium]|nr:NAD-dependent epimerase/dehydratase family protein [Bacteroidia bacterium]